MSNTTQEIWKTSRELYINHRSFPPPDEMFEQNYCWLLVLVDECKFCGERERFNLNIHWEFQLFCCWDRLKQHSISYDELKDKVPEILILCLIQIQQPAVLKIRRYLVTNVFSTLAQFYKIEGNLDIN
ncbi:f-box domain contaning protein [Gigaspora margarita]|uniref:F-box domain contaning protein n=1 Tax=Gigaspora margarita TaxID=4874 RepID=A0A8H4EJB3_GIGMA|nr:f-box domain contaning protein [Gigaspora margarita]